MNQDKKDLYMLKFLFEIFFGNWCKHDWDVIMDNRQTIREQSADSAYNVDRHFLLLKCKKCGKLTKKVV